MYGQSVFRFQSNTVLSFVINCILDEALIYQASALALASSLVPANTLWSEYNTFPIPNQENYYFGSSQEKAKPGQHRSVGQLAEPQTNFRPRLGATLLLKYKYYTCFCKPVAVYNIKYF